jgi:hypothetical protein
MWETISYIQRYSRDGPLHIIITCAIAIVWIYLVFCVLYANESLLTVEIYQHSITLFFIFYFLLKIFTILKILKILFANKRNDIYIYI